MESVQLSGLDHYFADYITRVEGLPCDGLWMAAALVSNAACNGHVCLDLHTAAGSGVLPCRPGAVPLQAPPVKDWLELLSGRTSVGCPGDYTPLVLDDAGRLYLHRSWDAERRVAEGILARCSLLPSIAGLAEGLECYFPLSSGEHDLQREAAQTALSRRFTVISGGPGTGKTTTVARILALFFELAAGDPPRILLAAPTGKAAMRLNQSLQDSIGRLPLSEAVRSAFPDEVSTIHRLLGVIPGRSEFRFNRGNPLQCDVLVVDEASMVDLPLMSRLLDALHGDTRLILLGDRDQLASVEAGAVLADICAGGALPGETAANLPAVVHLTRSYRFSDDSGIGRLSRLVNAGDGEAALELLTSGAFDDVRWQPLPAADAFDEAFSTAACKGYALFARSAGPDESLDALEHFRVLSPHRDGRHGVVNLNRLVGSAFGRRMQGGQPAVSRLPIMITGNSYDMGLFNGDTGVLVEAAHNEAAAAFFAGPEPGGRRISALRLPQHEAAFALTVHKSQGSEFDNVLLVIPDRLSEVLCRELLYTAITRARKRVEIWGDEEVFRRAVERRSDRNSGLRDRLAEGGRV